MRICVKGNNSCSVIGIASKEKRFREFPPDQEPMARTRTKAEEGFSLIELLIVVAIILIIAAIAIPNLLRSRMAANEASAVGSIRSVNTGAFSYNSIYSNGYPSTLTQVGTSAATQATCNASMFIDIVLTSGSKSGYSFAMGPGSVAATAPSGCAAAGYVDGFFIKAVPISAGTSGIRGFCSDQTRHHSLQFRRNCDRLLVSGLRWLQHKRNDPSAIRTADPFLRAGHLALDIIIWLVWAKRFARAAALPEVVPPE